jgi:predicted DNA-binding WGR domain protein
VSKSPDAATVTSTAFSGVTSCDKIFVQINEVSSSSRMSRSPKKTDAIALARIDPKRNMKRFYTAMLWPDLFGGVSLVREYGRIGQPGQLRVESYADLHAATVARDRLLARKRHKGYRPVT